jgi:hypothetical protein
MEENYLKTTKQVKGIIGGKKMAHQPKYTLPKQVIIIDDAREMEVPKSCTLSVSSSFLCHKVHSFVRA